MIAKFFSDRFLAASSLFLTFASFAAISNAEEKAQGWKGPSKTEPAPQGQTSDAAASLKAAYARSAAYKDMATAASLAHQLIEADSASAGKWKEELAKIYFTSKHESSCLLVCEDLIKNHGGDAKLPVLEMRALCFESLELKPEAISAWLMAWDKTHSPSQAVRLAGLYFQSENLAQCEEIINAGLVSKDAVTAMVSLPKTSSEMQSIPAAAALHNLKALLLLKKDPGNKMLVRVELEGALQLSPDFELAKRNLASLGPVGSENPVPKAE
jgi:hypothetical protein